MGDSFADEPITLLLARLALPRTEIEVVAIELDDGLTRDVPAVFRQRVGESRHVQPSRYGSQNSNYRFGHGKTVRTADRWQVI
jgi:hypothetical protein